MRLASTVTESKSSDQSVCAITEQELSTAKKNTGVKNRNITYVWCKAKLHKEEILFLVEELICDFSYFKHIAITIPCTPVKKCSWFQLKLKQETVFESIIEGLIQNGYVVLDDFLPKEVWTKLGEKLEHKWRQGNFVEAGIGKGVNAARNEKIRGDHIHWLETKDNEPEETIFLDKISSLISYLNQTCFTGLKDFEFHYALYPQGTFYHRHLDQFKGDVARKYSVVNYLNEDWEAVHGGQLVLYLDDGEKEILPVGGRLVCFESHMIEHEVKSGTRPRKSLTGWLRG